LIENLLLRGFCCTKTIELLPWNIFVQVKLLKNLFFKVFKTHREFFALYTKKILKIKEAI